MIGSINTNVAQPEENEPSKMSKLLDWANLAMNAGMNINSAMNAGSAAPSADLVAKKPSPYFLDWKNEGAK